MTLLEALYELFLMPPCMVLELPFTMAFNLTGQPLAAVVAMALVANLLAIPLHRRTRALGAPAIAADCLWLGFAMGWLACQPMVHSMLPYGPAVFVAATAACCLLRLTLDLESLGKGAKAKRGAHAAHAKAARTAEPARHSLVMHICCCLFLIVLVGCVGPATVLDRGATAFIDPVTYADPSWYLAHSLLQAIGCFGIWPTLLYAFCSDRGKSALNAIMLMACVAGLLNFIMLSAGFKRLQWTMEFNRNLAYDPLELVGNLVLMVAVCAALAAAWLKGFQVMVRIMPVMLVMATLTMTGSFALMLSDVSKAVTAEIPRLQAQAEAEKPSFTLSRTGKNVVVIMMDRALGTYFPYLCEELPQLKEQFRGFTFYDNTVSFSNKTNVASPCVYGGYDYTPERSYERNHDRLVRKQNEALKVMPVLFKKNGYDVTVLDPTYAGYTYVPDPSIYDKWDIPAYNAMYYYQDPDLCANVVANNKVNFFRYGLFRICPAVLQGLVYGDGSWCRSTNFMLGQAQTVSQNNQRSWGVKPAFIRGLNGLKHMKDMTQLTDDGQSFLMMSNDTMHEPCILQRPDYTPEYQVNNTGENASNPRRLTLNGTTIKLDDYMQEAIYSCNAAGLLELGKWFNYLREQGVWDNTRVIICADHGYDVFTVDGRTIDADVSAAYPDAQGDTSRFLDTDAYHPLLLVKDFGEDHPVQTSQEFMTHADVPALATQGAVRKAVNPFTGNPLAAPAGAKDEVHVFATHNWNPAVNKGYTFGTDGAWFSVSEDMRKGENWQLIDPPYDPELLETQGPLEEPQ
ncbi:MAG: sulfatase-like hydrolase/transferase [Coriobacteriia bacterium]|nr:sulfatase-like hydrolase/transferase [Coriobacteriia bacterium]